MLVRLIGDIDCEAVKLISEAVRGKGEIEIELHSMGGTAYDALAIYHLIRNSPNYIVVHALGTVQSAAVLVLAAGDWRKIAPETIIMVHEDSDDSPMGSLTHARRAAAQMLKEEHQWATILSKLTQCSSSEWYRMHKKTTYLNAAQAIEFGLADEVMEY